LAGWLAKAAAILAIVVLVTAFQPQTVAAPAPELSAPLISYAMLSRPAEPVERVEPTHTPPAPTATVAPTPQPTATPEPTREPLPTDPPDMLVLRRSSLPRTNPTVSYAPVLTAPVALPAAESLSGTARVPILMYHYISDPPPGSDSLRKSLSVTPANLDAQLSYLKQAGYQTITLDDLHGHLTQGNPLPAKPIILTFDDGYLDAYAEAMPILRKHGYVGTFFILTGPADRSGAGGYLSWAHIRAMSQVGMDMQLHSREHVDLRNRPNDYLVHQIAGGHDSIEAYTGKPVRWFAYPSGQYDAAVVRMLRSAGFAGAVTTIPGQTHTAAGLFDLQRVRIFGSDTLASFKAAVEGKR
jgi:peptidoglycan/xylan/chitin deacetylase (PgdA/CDA1 family)